MFIVNNQIYRLTFIILRYKGMVDVPEGMFVDGLIDEGMRGWGVSGSGCGFEYLGAAFIMVLDGAALLIY